jgi:hypothetical protein
MRYSPSIGQFRFQRRQARVGPLEHRQRQFLRAWHLNSMVGVVELDSDVRRRPFSFPHLAQEQIDVEVQKAQAVGSLNQVRLGPASIFVNPDQCFYMASEGIAGALEAEPFADNSGAPCGVRGVVFRIDQGLSFGRL